MLLTAIYPPSVLTHPSPFSPLRGPLAWRLFGHSEILRVLFESHPSEDATDYWERAAPTPTTQQIVSQGKWEE